ncbi:hypothetical protein, partial [Carbonactinospora thermoautotrophica]
AKQQSGQAPESLQVVDVAQLLLTSVKQPTPTPNTTPNGTGTGPAPIEADTPPLSPEAHAD